MAARLHLDHVQSEIERFKGMLQMLGENGEDLQNVMRYLDERMRDLNRLLREIIQQQQRKQGLEPRDFSQRSSLADKSFAFYTEDDIRRMNEAVARLAQRLEKSPVGAAQEGRPRPLRREKDPAQESPIRRRAVSHPARPAQKDQTAGDGAVRHLRFGAQRLALHAPVRLLDPGSLLQGAQLCLRRGDRRGHQAVRRA